MKTAADYVATTIRADVRAVKAYPVLASTNMIKLDAMENPYRLPDALRAEIGAALADAALNRYPDPDAPALKARLREAFDIPASADILIGVGSDEIIAMANLALAQDGGCALSLEPSFVMYKINAQWARLRYESFTLRADFSLDCDAFLARIAQLQPSLVWIAYPNNPTGNVFAQADIERVIRAAPGLVIVDEAYNVFARRSFMSRLPEFPNLMVMRTVSKIGLAGIRLGYAAAHPAWIDEFNKVRSPYNVSVLTQAAAEVILKHRDVLDAQADALLQARAAMVARLAQMPKVTVFPTEANFVLVRVPDAINTNEAMKAKKILIRSLHGWHSLLDNCLRLTVGTPEENALMLDALSESL